MATMKRATSEFLAIKCIAATGVSRTSKGHGANVVHQRLRDRGHEVFAIKPNTDQIEGGPCHRNLKAVPRPGADHHRVGWPRRPPLSPE